MVGVHEPLQRPQKENVAEFVARKREIFLVQMSLDTKRAEIRALQVSNGLRPPCQHASETSKLARHVDALHASGLLNPSRCSVRCFSVQSSVPCY